MNYHTGTRQFNKYEDPDRLNYYSKIIFIFGIVPFIINRNNNGKARINISTLQTLSQFDKELSLGEVNNCLAFLQKKRVINILKKSNNTINVELLYITD